MLVTDPRQASYWDRFSGHHHGYVPILQMDQREYWLISLVADDMIMATNNTSGLLGEKLEKRLEIKDMGDLAWSLGRQISRCCINRYVFCSKDAYLQEDPSRLREASRGEEAGVDTRRWKQNAE